MDRLLLILLLKFIDCILTGSSEEANSYKLGGKISPDKLNYFNTLAFLLESFIQDTSIRELSRIKLSYSTCRNITNCQINDKGLGYSWACFFLDSCGRFLCLFVFLGNKSCNFKQKKHGNFILSAFCWQ